MSIDMYLDHSDSQAEATKSMTTTQLSGYQEVQKSLSDFIDNSSQDLKGSAYDSLRNYLSNLILPLAQGGELLTEACKQSVQRFPQAYREQVSEDSLKESELEEKIAVMDELISIVNAQIEVLGSKSETSMADFHLMDSYLSKRDVYDLIRAKLQEKLDKLRAFNASSPSIFSEIAELESLLATGMEQAGGAWDPVAGTYAVPSDLSWAATISDRYAVKDLSPSERAYVKNLQEQYGFDVTTAKQVLKVKQGIDQKFPDKSEEYRDYLLLRVLGGITYGGFAWDNTAGDLVYYFYNITIKGNDNIIHIVKPMQEILEELGLTSEEAKNLQYNVRKQHDFSGISGKVNVYGEQARDYERRFNLYKQYHNTEGKSEHDLKIEFENSWSRDNARYTGKTDFTHQAITTATHLNPTKLQLSDLNGGRENVKDLSGWKGDITNAADATPSIGNDDYKADLDSVNIVKRMERTGQSYMQASNDYYHELAIGETNRANEFKSNIGWRHIEDTAFLYNALAHKVTEGADRLAPGNSLIRDLTSEEKRAYIKDNAPVVHNFLESLKNNQNDLQEYVEIGGAE